LDELETKNFLSNLNHPLALSFTVGVAAFNKHTSPDTTEDI